jgi:hypothetical protein
LCFIRISKSFLGSKSKGGVETIIRNVFGRFRWVRYAKGTLCAQTTAIRLVRMIPLIHNRWRTLEGTFRTHAISLTGEWS